MPSGASGCAALQQSAKPKESTEKLRWRSSGAKPKTGSFTSRNGLAGGDNLESCPRVFTVNIFRAPGNSGERRRMHFTQARYSYKHHADHGTSEIIIMMIITIN